MWRLLFLILPIHSFAQSSLNVQLLDNWKDETIIATSDSLKYSDCWGYEFDGREYAMLGSTEGVHFFEIVKNKLEERDFVEGSYSHPSVIHRDIKVYDHYAFAVCDEGTSSLQIIDLQYLPDSVHLIYENDSTFTRVHNLFIDESNNLLYACSVRPSSGGTLQGLIPMQVYDISDLLNPVLRYSGPIDIPEVHDVYVRDNIAYLNCGFDGVRVYDFSNPSSPQFLQNFSFYQDQGYNHQGWLSPDGTKYVFGDETNGKKLKLCSVENNQIDVEGNFGTNFLDESVAHNVMITNEYAFVAYYNEGLRIYDIRHKLPKEIAHYDTYPEEEELFKMNGAWGIYSELRSGKILVSDRKNGLFLLNFNREAFLSDYPNDISIYPNPIFQDDFIIRLKEDQEPNFTIEIYDMLGRVIYDETHLNANHAVIQSPKVSGIYNVRISYPKEDGKEVVFDEKVMVY